MCVRRRSDGTDNMERLKGGSACVHRTKKALYKTKEVRKKLKCPSRACADCARMTKAGQALPENETNEILMCITCAQLACHEHAKKHCDAVRSGEPHPFLLSLETSILRCHPCDVELEPIEDHSDPVRLFYNDYKSFVKTKADTAAIRKSEVVEKPVMVEGRPHSQVSVVPVAVQEYDEEERLNGTVKTKKHERKSVVVAAHKEQIVDNDEADSNLKGSDKKYLNGTTSNGTSAPATATATKKNNGRANGYALANGTGDALRPAKGLSNLGNTCFFNSVMQCVMHTHHLQYYFERLGRVTKLDFNQPRTVVVNEDKVQLDTACIECSSEQFPMNSVLSGFIGEFRSGTAPSPNSVFSEISRRAPRFRGWQQQDAHELLRYLLDGLRSEEQDRYKQAIAQYLGIPGAKSKTKIDPELMKQAKGYLQAAGRPLLDSVFGGTLLQTIRCSECGHVSERYEQFLDLSIPLSANPMSARAAAGRNPAPMSAHQKKKAEKLAKKSGRRNARQEAAKRPGNNKIADEKADEVAAAMEQLDMSDNESESSCSDEEERTGAGQDPLDYTKVLVSPPAEYSHGRSIGSCLLEFTAEERLTGPNAYECEKCCSPRNKKADAKGPQKKRVEALKRYLVYEPPSVLTLHLKRFQQIAGITGRLSTRKLGGHVNFPALFDIAPFCCKNVERISSGQKRVIYSLYGVVVHSGDLSGGHYIAYVKSRHRVKQALSFLESARASCVDSMFEVPTGDLTATADSDPASPDGQWYYCSDSRVNAVAESRVMQAEAYILFYERIL